MKSRKKIVLEISATEETSLTKQNIYEVLTESDKRYIVDAELVLRQLIDVYTDKDMIEFAEFCENDKYPQFDELLRAFKSTKRASNR